MFSSWPPTIPCPYVDNNTQNSLWVINITTSPPSPSSLNETKNWGPLFSPSQKDEKSMANSRPIRLFSHNFYLRSKGGENCQNSFLLLRLFSLTGYLGFFFKLGNSTSSLILLTLTSIKVPFKLGKVDFFNLEPVNPNWCSCLWKILQFFIAYDNTNC